MHDTAFDIGRRVLELYARPGSVIVDVGSLAIDVGPVDFAASLRSVKPEGSFYLGLDLHPGPSVDLVIKAGETLPLRDDFADLVLATSMFEHDQFFWETFLDLVRVAKPGGIIYVNAPSNGKYHRYPRDCWRFYPDCGCALEAWARKNGQPATLIESFTALRKTDCWNDFVALFVKASDVDPGTIHFISDHVPYSSARHVGVDSVLIGDGFRFGGQDIEFLVEDMAIIEALRGQARSGTSDAPPAGSSETDGDGGGERPPVMDQTPFASAGSSELDDLSTVSALRSRLEAALKRTA